MSLCSLEFEYDLDIVLYYLDLRVFQNYVLFCSTLWFVRRPTVGRAAVFLVFSFFLCLMIL